MTPVYLRVYLQCNKIEQMDNKYRNKNMKKRFSSSTFLRMIFFLFLIVSATKNIHAQCITPGNTTICYGDSANFCANANTNVSSFLYTEDFENAVSINEWSSTNLLLFNGSTVLGNFANNTPVLTLNSLPTHDSILLEFDLYIHDSWDGLTENELFSVSVDGDTILSESFQSNMCERKFTNWIIRI